MVELVLSVVLVITIVIDTWVYLRLRSDIEDIKAAIRSHADVFHLGHQRPPWEDE